MGVSTSAQEKNTHLHCPQIICFDLRNRSLFTSNYLRSKTVSMKRMSFPQMDADTTVKYKSRCLLR